VKRAARGLALLCLAAAAVATADALWIPAKAQLAQLLLARAWQRAAAGEPAPRPWPWADTWPVARLVVPRLEIERIVLAGADGSSLAFAPGHMAGTAAPGEAGNSVVAGHRDTSFRFLARLAAGDRIEVERPDGVRHAYRVTEMRVVDAQDPWALAEEAGSTLTLATCWPFGALVPGGRQRYVVRARRIEAAQRQPAVAAVHDGAGTLAARLVLSGPLTSVIPGGRRVRSTSPPCHRPLRDAPAPSAPSASWRPSSPWSAWHSASDTCSPPTGTASPTPISSPGRSTS
jgi:sortase A